MARDKKSKRQLIRDEKKAKKRQRELENDETKQERKRQRIEAAEGDEDAPFNEDGYNGGAEQPQYNGGGGGSGEPEREFFGMLTDEEQEYFRSADEKLETNDFESDEDRGYFLQSIYTEAVGKELKLASSQSCSRLMERLILLSNTRQKKRLFEAFTEHFVTLVTHRFASHCCEKLFIQSAPIVTRELSGMPEEEEQAEEDEEGEGEQKATKASMEELFLFTLDELEAHLSYLLSDRFGSHALRVLLMVLSGRPLDQVSTKSLLQSKRKEHISVQGGRTETDEMNGQVRIVPETFALATQKILEDTTSSMDSTALRVLATHPTGNPVLQLMVDLDISLNGKDKEKRDQLLLLKLLPDAPESLSDNSTPASDFVNSMMYDPIGSRLLETIVTHAPAKIFKALNANFFSPRIHTYMRNDIACYPAIKALNRMGKDDVAESARKMVPEIPKIVVAKRYNVLKALFERCNVRQVTEELEGLLEAVCAAYDSTNGLNLIPKLCGLDDESTSEDDDPAKKFQPSLQTDKQKAATVSHGCQLATALLGIPGAPASTLQNSMLSLSSDQLVHLATSTTPSMIVIRTALSSPAQVPNFHKAVVTKLAPRVMELAHSQIGHNVVNAIVGIPSKAAGGPEAQAGVVPFHLKERIMTTLGAGEKGLRESWTGRSVWRTWKGDQWKFRRGDWVRFVKEVDPEVKPEEKLWNRVAEKEKAKAKKGKKDKSRDRDRPRGQDGEGDDDDGNRE